MSKKVMYGLILLALAVIVIVFNTRAISINLVVMDDVRAMAALVYLAFTAVGVTVGLLLK